MENVIDTEGQTRFFDELGRKFYVNLHRDPKVKRFESLIDVIERLECFISELQLGSLITNINS